MPTAGGTRVDVSVVTTGHDVADARLHREVAAFVRRGLRVEVLGLGSPADGPADAVTTTRPRRGMLVRLVRSLVWPWRARGRVVLTLDPDTVPSALLAAAARRRRLVADVHEDFVALVADRAWLPPRLLRPVRWLVAAAVRSAGRAHLTVVADDHVPPGTEVARERLVLTNLPDLSMLPRDAAGDPRTEDPLRALYVGDLRRSRGGREMVEAVAASPGWELDLVGPAPASEADWLSARLAEPDVAGRVRWHGRMPPVRAWELARGAHVGLVLLAPTPAFVEAMPTKVYEYLACGLAVLGSPLPRVSDLLDAAGAGETLPADQAAAALTRWAADRDALAAHLAAARRWAEEQAGASSYDELAERVARLAGR